MSTFYHLVVLFWFSTSFAHVLYKNMQIKMKTKKYKRIFAVTGTNTKFEKSSRIISQWHKMKMCKICEILGVKIRFLKIKIIIIFQFWKLEILYYNIFQTPEKVCNFRLLYEYEQEVGQQKVVIFRHLLLKDVQIGSYKFWTAHTCIMKWIRVKKYE